MWIYEIKAVGARRGDTSIHCRDLPTLNVLFLLIAAIVCPGCHEENPGPKHFDITVKNVGTTRIEEFNVIFGDENMAPFANLVPASNSGFGGFPVPQARDMLVRYELEGGKKIETEFSIEFLHRMEVYGVEFVFLVDADKEIIELKVNKRETKESEWEEIERHSGQTTNIKVM